MQEGYFEVKEGEEVTRARLPRGKEVLGIIDEMLGGSRFRVSCMDGKTRMCRVSGKFKKRNWVKIGDVVIIEPWEVESDEKGNVIWKYRKAQVEWLIKRGLLKV